MNQNSETERDFFEITKTVQSKLKYFFINVSLFFCVLGDRYHRFYVSLKVDRGAELLRSIFLLINSDGAKMVPDVLGRQEKVINQSVTTNSEKCR